MGRGRPAHSPSHRRSEPLCAELADTITSSVVHVELHVNQSRLIVTDREQPPELKQREVCSLIDDADQRSTLRTLLSVSILNVDHSSKGSHHSRDGLKASTSLASEHERN